MNNSKSAHTPGPWRTVRRANQAGTRSMHLTRDKVIALVAIHAAIKQARGEQ